MGVGRYGLPMHFGAPPVARPRRLSSGKQRMIAGRPLLVAGRSDGVIGRQRVPSGRRGLGLRVQAKAEPISQTGQVVEEAHDVRDLQTRLVVKTKVA